MHKTCLSLSHLKLHGVQRAGALSVALGHRPQPVKIPAETSSTETSPDMLPPHAAIIGSPTTTAPVMASIRRTRSNGEDGMQVGTCQMQLPTGFSASSEICILGLHRVACDHEESSQI